MTKINEQGISIVRMTDPPCVVALSDPGAPDERYDRAIQQAVRDDERRVVGYTAGYAFVEVYA